MLFRTDKHNNPTAFTTDVAKEAALVEGVEYSKGDPFQAGTPEKPLTLYTAKLIGDPVYLTIKVLDKIGFYTKAGQIRWNYIGIPNSVWNTLSVMQKKMTIAAMYSREQGTAMKAYFI